jgi:para-aminobenzoate synthetase component 1
MPGAPRRDISLPIARWGLYDSGAIYDSVTGGWRIIAADLRPVHPAARPPAVRIAEWRELLAAASPLRPAGAAGAGVAEWNLSLRDYISMVWRAKEYISAGDIFQVNLARRLSLRQSEPPAATYLRLRRMNPAAYAAFLTWDHGRSAILSASPELFLDLRGREVVTRPIKGTRPRSADPIVDASLREELLTSEKDRAELAMIVDLERNDLGRVCAFGTVGVLATESRKWKIENRKSFASLESHPTVHHLVATIRGTLREDCDGIDLLRATFPGGSITGAPKVRAMQIIDELEPVARSVYTGAIGCIGLDGSMQLNIAIRTLIAADGRMHAYVGSGIVADSDPQAEYAETAAKAAGLCRALGLAEDVAELSSAGA